uniref:Ig-like domain-containing protein n=1 Tax=Pundamilia nyererei TaxID=303518 RepID=A0A3B4FMN6_9CICH
GGVQTHVLKFTVDLCVYLAPSSDTKWKINVERKITAQPGSTVTIQCNFSYPKEISTNNVTVFWKTNGDKDRKKYRGKTKLIGDPNKGNCSLQITDITDINTDVGPFYFRIEMPQYKSFSYTQNAVSIDVIRNPPSPTLSVEVNDQAYATCSVFHSCPSIPPQFSWSHTGVIKRQWKKVNAWNWQTVSTLTFLPLATDFNKPLNCTVRHRGGKEAQSSIILLSPYRTEPNREFCVSLHP